MHTERNNVSNFLPVSGASHSGIPPVELLAGTTGMRPARAVSEGWYFAPLAPNERNSRRRPSSNGGDAQNRTGDGGFADLCLATWLRRRLAVDSTFDAGAASLAVRLWSTCHSTTFGTSW